MFKNNYLQVVKLLSLCIIITLIIASCTNKNISQNFESNFNTTEARTWVGPEYWANPLQDWQISNGHLECLVSKKNRNIHVLTKKLDTVKADFEMKVSLQLLNTNSTSKNINWVGFSLGSKGEFNDYRDNAIFGKGLNVGVTTNGNLFIDKLPEVDTLNENIQNLLQENVDLRLLVKPK